MMMIPEDAFFPGTKWHAIGDGIQWRPYKHWGQGCWAGEGKEIHEDDRSGCIHIVNGHKWTSVPCVVEARIYRKGDLDISAVFSYPNGIGLEDHYFWEIYEEILRFDTEEEMEEAIKLYFLTGRRVR